MLRFDAGARYPAMRLLADPEGCDLSWFGFGKQRVSRRAVAESIGASMLETLRGPVANRLAPDAMRAGSRLDFESIVRECYYLLQFSAHLALLKSTRPYIATEILQHIADAATPELHKAGWWPVEDSLRLSRQYSQRREEFVRALEGLPADELQAGLESVLTQLVFRITGSQLQLPSEPFPAGVYGALGGIAYGHLSAVATLLKAVRIT